jgi:hypothetical protein
MFDRGETDSSAGRIRVNWRRCDGQQTEQYRKYANDLLGPVWYNSTPSIEAVEIYTEHITRTLFRASAQANLPCIKPKTTKAHIKPYWSPSNLSLPHNEMMVVRSNWITLGRPRSGNEYLEYKCKKREFQRAHRRAKHQYKQSMLAEIERSCELDINSFYKIVRKGRKNKTDAMISTADGTVCTDSNEIRNVWYEHFVNPSQ